MQKPDSEQTRDLQRLRATRVLDFLETRYAEAKSHLVDTTDERTTARIQGKAQAYRDLIRYITHD